MIKGIWNNVEGRPGDKIIKRLRLKKLRTSKRSRVYGTMLKEGQVNKILKNMI
jgi:hypothetical protein